MKGLELKTSGGDRSGGNGRVPGIKSLRRCVVLVAIEWPISWSIIGGLKFRLEKPRVTTNVTRDAK